VTYTQVFDAENRLISVTAGEGEENTTHFVYDGAGNLMKKINPDDSYVLYIGSVLEVAMDADDNIVQTTIYYPAGGAVRVITEATNELFYVLGDQIGSASLVLDDEGEVAGEMRYYPFGETRSSSGSFPTDKLFTGQRLQTDLGIYHYNARFYDLYRLSTLPGKAPLCLPFSITILPFTKTYSMPSGYWCGWVKVALSITRAGSKTVTSAK
jgi:YD repeat-containing protein